MSDLRERKLLGWLSLATIGDEVLARLGGAGVRFYSFGPRKPVART